MTSRPVLHIIWAAKENLTLIDQNLLRILFSSFFSFLLVIDFGFAKRVPYTSIDASTGETKVHAKTYTLCGTPGVYLQFL